MSCTFHAVLLCPFFALTATAQNPAVQNAPPRYDSIESVLTRVLDDDQYYRLGIDSTQKKYGWHSPQMNRLWKTINSVDSANLSKVRHSLDAYGWLGIDEVGEKASLAQFLVIQHADSATQSTYLPVMRKAVEHGKAKADQLALLEDRVLTNQGKPQRYGSQVKTNAKGKYELFPIADEPNVNQRRASVGLEPLEVYARNFGIDYHLPAQPASR